jgi:predicted RNA-binding Zn ribbon-like protein
MTTEPSTCEAQPAKKFQLVGGELCLDFTNTVGGKRGAVARENLHRYEDLLSWFEQVGVVDAVEAKKLLRAAGADPVAAARVLERAVELREAIYGVFAAIMDDRQPARADLEKLNGELSLALGRLRVVAMQDKPGCNWVWAACGGELSAPLGPVARSAAELLTDERRLRQVHQCGGDNCGWLFLDASKNHSRRWCDMRDCGNRAKVKRYRMRERGEEQQPAS